jgi:hypothetical protein
MEFDWRGAGKILEVSASDLVDSHEILKLVPDRDGLERAKSFIETKGMSHIRVYTRMPCCAGFKLSRIDRFLGQKQMQIDLRKARHAFFVLAQIPHV